MARLIDKWVGIKSNFRERNSKRQPRIVQVDENKGFVILRLFEGMNNIYFNRLGDQRFCINL